MFTYCLNSPVNGIDPNGDAPAWIENLNTNLQDLIEKVKGALVKEKEKERESSGTLSVGVSFAAGAGGGGSISGGLAMDNRLNFGVVSNYSSGSTLPSASANAYISMTDASSIYALGGDYGSTLIVGASVGEEVGGGIDFLLIHDPEKKGRMSSGVTVQGGFTAKVPVPFEIHAQAAGGYVIGFNLYDVLISACDYAIQVLG